MLSIRLHLDCFFPLLIFEFESWRGSRLSRSILAIRLVIVRETSRRVVRNTAVLSDRLPNPREVSNH